MILAISLLVAGMILGYIVMWGCISYRIGQEWKDLHNTREYIIQEMIALREDLRGLKKDAHSVKNVLPFNRDRIK